MELILTHVLALQSMFVMLILSAFFSCAETAFFSLSKQQLADMRKSNSRTGALILSFLDKPGELLTTILLGNMIVNILFFCTSATLSEHIGKTYGELYQFVAGAVVLIVMLLCSEVLPKALGVAHPLTFAHLTALPLLLWQLISTPFRRIIFIFSQKLEPKSVQTEKKISADELKMLLKMSREEGKLNVLAGEIIEDIMEISTLKIKHVMIPRTELIMCPAEMSVADAIEFARQHKFYYLLAYKGDEENLEGIADIKELCLFSKKTDSIEKYLKPPTYMPTTKKVGELLDEMIKSDTVLVVTVDEFGGLAGIVTVKDILERIVGSMDGEFTEADDEMVEQLGDNIFRVKGSLSTSNWKDFFSNPILEEQGSALDITTIGGFVTHLLGKIPQVGDSVKFRNLNFTVEEMSERRIEAVILRINGES